MVECGKKIYTFIIYFFMNTFIGDYTCKLDAKGRIMFPSAFKKQMAAASEDRFVIKKEIFENCLVLYPIGEWERQNDIIRQKLNPYNKEHNRFLREFYKGSAELALDSNNRLLIPKRLLDLVNIEKDVILAGQDGKIEIWAKDSYEKTSMSGDEFASLANKILGGSGDKNQ